MKRKIIGFALAVLLFAPPVYAASWKTTDTEDDSVNGGEIVMVENEGGTDNNWMSLTTIKAWVLNALSAASVAVADADEYFTGTNVETVLKEIWEALAGKLDAGDVVTVSADVETMLGSANNAAIRSNIGVNAKYLSGTEVDFYGTLLDPQAIYAVDGTNHAVTIANNVPAAFTITEISVSCDANPTTEITLTFQHKTAGIGYGSPTTIEAVQTTDGAATITTGFDDATIPAGTKLFMTLSDPDDALNECSWQIEGDWD